MVGSPGQKTQSKSRDATSSSNTSPMIVMFERPVAAGAPLAAPSLFALLTGGETASKPVQQANRTGPNARGSAAPEGRDGDLKASAAPNVDWSHKLDLLHACAGRSEQTRRPALCVHLMYKGLTPSIRNASTVGILASDEKHLASMSRNSEVAKSLG